MWIDFIWLTLMVFAAVKGFKNGLIVSLFSVAGLVIGLIAAMKFSTIVSGYISESFQMPLFWLPIVSFMLVFIAVAALVRLAAVMLSKVVEAVFLGWVNKLSGFLLYAIVYTLVFSVFLFYCDKTIHFTNTIREKSFIYNYIAPWGEWTIDKIGIVIPWIKNTFVELESYFGKLALKISNQ